MEILKCHSKSIIRGTIINMYTEIGKYLKILRVINDESQQKMAKRLGISPAFLSKVENGISLPPLKWQQMIQNEYSLNEKETEELKNAINISRTCSPNENIINISNLKMNDQELIRLFVKQIKKIRPEEKEKIKRKLKSLE